MTRAFTSSLFHSNCWCELLVAGFANFFIAFFLLGSSVSDTAMVNSLLIFLCCFFWIYCVVLGTDSTGFVMSVVKSGLSGAMSAGFHAMSFVEFPVNNDDDLLRSP
jgi:hypothetical protein